MKKYYTIFIVLLTLSSILMIAESRAQIPTEGLVAWYPFDGNANDESGNENHGIMNGNLAATSDRFGHFNNAFQFDGETTNVFIDSAFHLLNLGQSQYSICGWFSVSDIAKSLQCLINSIPHRGLVINYNHVNVPPYMMSYGIGPGYPEDVSWTFYHEGNISNLMQDQWYFFTAIKNDTNYRFLINGILDHNVVLHESSSYNGEMGFVIGSICLFGGFGEFFNGKLDDFRFYDRALNESEVLAIYHEFVAVGVDESAVGSWQLAVSIYPSPSSKQITLEIPTKPDKNTTLNIYNINGKALVERLITEKQTVLDVSGLPPGVYLVKVVSDDGVLVGKFVKE